MHYDGNYGVLFLRNAAWLLMEIEKRRLYCKVNFDILVTKFLLGGTKA